MEGKSNKILLLTGGGGARESNTMDRFTPPATYSLGKGSAALAYYLRAKREEKSWQRGHADLQFWV